MQSNDPKFKSVFKTTWHKLPPVFLKRYANRPYSKDIVSVEGKMEVSFSTFMSFIMPILRLMHILAPHQGKDILVKVNFRSTENSDATILERTFYFPGKKPYEFNSCVQPTIDSEVIEFMSYGLGWKIHYFYDGEKVIMEHKGYVWKLFGYNIPVPLEFFIGKGHTKETVIDDNSYRVTMSISHPLFGVLYSYAGNFTFTRLLP